MVEVAGTLARTRLAASLLIARKYYSRTRSESTSVPDTTVTILQIPGVFDFN